MDTSFWISSVGLGVIAPLLIQLFKTKATNLNYWGKLLFAFGICALIGTGNAYLNGAFKTPIVDWNTLSAAIVTVFLASQVVWKTTFESHFNK
ncbi:MAG: hypothetical protein WC346_17450 [Methanogenium sp.]|jgi:ABC-type polysaccharide/polyol phosphate export permease